MRLISQSELRAHRRCQREHHYQYALGYRPIVKSDALAFGTMVHKGLEAWWKAPKDQRITAALMAIADEPDNYERAKASAMLVVYDETWSSQELEPLAVEVEFRAPIINPATAARSRTYELVGKIDAIARDATGRVLVVEHKTTSQNVEVGSPYWRRLQLDTQISAYFVGARALGFEPAACLYDVLVKPRLAPLLATPEDKRKWTKTGELYAGQRLHDETVSEYRARVLEALRAEPAKFFARKEIVRLEHEEAEAMADIWLASRAMREAEVAHRAARNSDACERYGSTCPFFAVCVDGASLDDATRYRRAERAHEELSAPEEISK